MAGNSAAGNGKEKLGDNLKPVGANVLLLVLGVPLVSSAASAPTWPNSIPAGRGVQDKGLSITLGVLSARFFRL